MPRIQVVVDIWRFLGRKLSPLPGYLKRSASVTGSVEAPSFISEGDYFVEYEFADDDFAAMDNPHDSIGVVNESVPSSDVSGMAFD